MRTSEIFSGEGEPVDVKSMPGVVLRNTEDGG